MPGVPGAPGAPGASGALEARERGVLRVVRPQTPNQLHEWLRCVLGVEVPRAPTEPGSSAPFDYLCHAFFEGAAPESPDGVVWANRGGGKTFYAAVATLLDLAFKPGIEVRILGGSLEQSGRAYEHLRRLFEREEMRGLVDGAITERRLRLRNGSRAEILAQSEASVRGTRPQKLRCDEVDLFDPEVWEAAQLTTRSRVCGEGAGAVLVRGAVEAIGTMHRPRGLMASLTRAGNGRRVFRWGFVDVLERCPQERACAACPLWDECAGRAKSPSRARTGAGQHRCAGIGGVDQQRLHRPAHAGAAHLLEIDGERVPAQVERRAAGAAAGGGGDDDRRIG